MTAVPGVLVAAGAGRSGDPLAVLPAVLRLGTRRSALAMVQSRWVADRLTAALAGLGRQVEVRLVEITTLGDVTTAPLAGLGGTGVFVSALRDALLEGRIDLAVHSLKDLPTAPADGLVLAAVPAREDPRDALVAGPGRTLDQLPPGARIGTGSPRRAAQLHALGRGLQVVGVRGNVDTRIGKVADGSLDGVVLALAGLRRLGREAEAGEVFSPDTMLPAPGQGALAVECRADDPATGTALALLEDAATRTAVTAERALLARLEAGCSAPVGALAELNGGVLTLHAFVGSADGGFALHRSASQGPAGPSGPNGTTDPNGTAGSGPNGTAGSGPNGSNGAEPGRDGTTSGPAPGTSPEAAHALGVALAEQLLADGADRALPAPQRREPQLHPEPNHPEPNHQEPQLHREPQLHPEPPREGDS